MSESILPWISAYLIATGEEYGADLTAIPFVTTKKKKVQLVEFLTYGRDEIIWARASDKEYIVPIRFSREAVEEYTKLSRSHIIEDKNAIISISQFRPFFARIPQGKGRMSEGSFLALECNSAVLVGGRGEPKFGRPQPLETNPDLKEWSEGLKEHGGAGNCLKNRKEEQEFTNVSVIPEPRKPIESSPTSKKAGTSTNQARAALASKPHNFHQTWSISRKPSFRRPPDDVASELASMKVNDDEDSARQIDQNKSEPPRKRRRISALPLTPSPAVSQSSSRTRSATPFSEAEWPPSELPRHDTPPSSPTSPASSIPVSSSQPRHPTPAQRLPKRPTPTLPPSSPPSPMKRNADVSHPLHITLVHESMLVPSPTESPPTHARREVNRKVPRPPQPFRSERLLAEPIILAPDSDLSLSHSQSQTQSQSQSQSQPVVLSQLSQLRRNPFVGAPPDQNQSRNSPVGVDAIDNKDRNRPMMITSVDPSGARDDVHDNDTSQPGDDPHDTDSHRLNSSPPADEELDSDDAQTHINLFKRQRSNQLPNEIQSAVRPDEPTLSAPREVQHDPGAWAVPSFQVARKKVQSKKVKARNNSERQGTTNNKAEPMTDQTPERAHRSENENDVKPNVEDRPLQGPQDDADPHKKRKRGVEERDTDALTEVTNGELDTNKKQKLDDHPRHLKEFINVQLTSIPLEDDLGVVSWEMLYGILVGTARDRMKGEGAV